MNESWNPRSRMFHVQDSRKPLADRLSPTISTQAAWNPLSCDTEVYDSPSGKYLSLQVRAEVSMSRMSE